MDLLELRQHLLSHLVDFNFSVIVIKILLKALATLVESLNISSVTSIRWRTCFFECPFLAFLIFHVVFILLDLAVSPLWRCFLKYTVTIIQFLISKVCKLSSVAFSETLTFWRRIFFF